MDFISLIPWGGFLLMVFFLLALDLGVLNRKVHVISTKEALKWTGLWMSLAMLFSVFIYFAYGGHWFGLGLHEGATLDAGTAAFDYITGYFIEETLSLDNVAVMAMIMASFGIPLKYQHRVLFWGILGALILRGLMIGIGAAAVARFEFILYIFGAFLIWIAIRTMVSGEDETDPQEQFITKFLKKHFRYTGKVEGMHFFKKIDGKEYITPLMAALIVIEFSDIIFAVDSIPAIFGITTDPYIVFTSNIFAILGLRSLYFVLASIIERFRYLKFSVGVILLFVGVKLLLNPALALIGMGPVHLPNWTSLVIVFGCVIIGVIASVIYDKNHPEAAAEAKAKLEAKHAAEEAVEAAAEAAEKSE